MMPPRVSVVITAHNAAGVIGACLESVDRQAGFAPGEIEVVLVDDRSDDGTLEAATSAAVNRLRTIRVDEAPSSSLTTRQAALDRGVRAAAAPVICVTDADALPAADWIGRTAAACLGGRADLTAAPVGFRGGSTWLRALQTVDSAFYIAWCRMLAAMGFESGILFGNAAFTRAAYERIGGMQALGQTLVEDLAFARAARRAGLRLAFTSAARVSVRALSTLDELVERSRRTSGGGTSMLFASLIVWMLSLPLLTGVAAWTQHPWLVAAAAARYAVGLALTGAATMLSGGFRAVWMVPVYDVIALALGVVILGGGRRQAVTWGGVEYPRGPRA